MNYKPIGDKTVQNWIDRLISDKTFNSLSDTQKLQYVDSGQQNCAVLSNINGLEPYKVAGDNGLHLIQSYGTKVYNYYIFSSGIHGQSFKGDGRILSSVEFLLGIFGTPTGTCVAHLYAHQGVYGVSGTPGSILADSSAVNVSTIPHYPGSGYIAFDFSSSNYTLINGTPYIVAVEFDAGSSNDYIIMNTGGIGVPTGYGNYTYFNSGTWYSVDRVANFKVYSFRN
jgi:hypothetical protein